MISVRNFNPQTRVPLKLKEIRLLIEKVLKSENKKINSIYVNFVKNRHILAINKKYLKHNYKTDILTFNYSRRRDNIDGEIIISLPIVRANSSIFKTGFKNESKRVLIHGCLHLAGYEDKTKDGKKLMMFKENLYLNM